MNKEVKQEKSKKISMTYAIIALIVVIVGGIMLFKSNNTDATVQKQKTTVATKAEPEEERAVARIDISAPLVDEDKQSFEVYVNGSDTPEKQAGWMAKMGIQGSVVQSDNKSINLIVKVLENTEIKLSLRGPDKRDENNRFVPVWVNYTSVTINGVNILSEPVSVWHSKPFVYNIDAEKGEEYEIKAVWNSTAK